MNIMRDDRKNVIVEKTIEFSLKVIDYCELLNSKNKFVLSNNFLNQELPLGQMLEKLKMLRVKQTLFIR
jgi:hypothetical protein